MSETTETDQQADNLEDSDIMEEIDRVLENQFSIIQEQQSQATKLIRVGLTVAGLVLSVLSIVASQLGSAKIMANILSSNTRSIVIILSISLLFILGFMILVFRGLLPALAVLRPELMEGTISNLFSKPIGRNEKIGKKYKEKLESEGLPEEVDDNFFNKKITFRYGVDAEKTSTLFNTQNKKSELIKYKIGCLFGNQILIEENRTHLSTVYRVASVVISIFAISIGYIAVISYLYTQFAI